MGLGNSAAVAYDLVKQNNLGKSLRQQMIAGIVLFYTLYPAHRIRSLELALLMAFSIFFSPLPSLILYKKSINIINNCEKCFKQ